MYAFHSYIFAARIACDSGPIFLIGWSRKIDPDISPTRDSVTPPLCFRGWSKSATKCCLDFRPSRLWHIVVSIHSDHNAREWLRYVAHPSPNFTGGGLKFGLILAFETWISKHSGASKIYKMLSYRRDRAAGCVGFEQKWKTGTGRQYFTDILRFILNHCNIINLRNLSKIKRSSAELLIILRIFAHVMSRRGLDLWPLDLELLQHFGCHASYSVRNLSKIE